MQHGSAAESMKLAHEDEEAAQILLAGGASNRMIGLCCQQAVEKMLKAVLIAQNIEPPFRHPLAPLLRELESAGEALPASFSDRVVLGRSGSCTRPSRGRDVSPLGTTAPQRHLTLRWPKGRVQLAELNTSVLGRKLPGHGTRCGVAVSPPRCDFCRQGVPVRDAPVETLFGQDSQFDLGDNGPGAVFRRRPEGARDLQLVGQSLGLAWIERGIERGGRTGVHRRSWKYEPGP